MVPVGPAPADLDASPGSHLAQHAGCHASIRPVHASDLRVPSLPAIRFRPGWVLAILTGWMVPPGLAQESTPALAQQPTPAASPVQAPTPTAVWSGTVGLYGYLPWLQSTTTVRGFETATDLGPGQILEKLQSTFSGRASLERNRLGILVDASYNQLGAEPSRTTPRGLLTGRAEVTSINGVYDVALRWRQGVRESAVGTPGSGWLIPYAGLRVVQARLDVAAELQGSGPLSLRLQRQGTLERAWAQPLLGARGSLFLTPRLRAFVRGDLGGFGLAGAEDLSATAQAGFGYAIGNSTDLNLSWRYQGLRWNNGNERSNGFTVDQNGIEVGVKLYF